MGPSKEGIVSTPGERLAVEKSWEELAAMAAERIRTLEAALREIVGIGETRDVVVARAP